jgi:hypothetical protein
VSRVWIHLLASYWFDSSRLVDSAVGCFVSHPIHSGLSERKSDFLNVDELSLHDGIVNFLAFEKTFGVGTDL